MPNPFESMARRRRPYHFPIVDDVDGPKAARDAAQRRLSRLEAQAANPLLGPSVDPDEIEQARRELDDARKAYDQCFGVVWFEQNTAAVEVYQQKIAERGKVGKNYKWWADANSAEVYLIAECAVDVGMSAEQWSTELQQPRWTMPARGHLLEVVSEANDRVAYDVGKD